MFLSGSRESLGSTKVCMSLRISACSKENTELCRLSKGLRFSVHKGHAEGSKQASVGSLEEKVQVLS